MDASIVAERILESNTKSVKINGHEISPKTSIGISFYPKDGNDINILLKKADAAMYYAKGKGKNKYMYYKSHMINEDNLTK